MSADLNLDFFLTDVWPQCFEANVQTVQVALKKAVLFL